jgi:hypothetical protein
MAIGKKLRAFFFVLGCVMNIMAIADAPAKLAVFHDWFIRLAPYLHTMTARWVLGIAGVLIASFPWIMEWNKNRHTMSTAVPIIKRVLVAALIPHGENSPNVYLEVVNNGESAYLSAQFRILAKSYGDGVKKYAYDGFWSDRVSLTYDQSKGVIKDYGRSMQSRVDAGKSDLLRVAEMDPVRKYGISTLRMVGIDEILQWDFEPNRNSELPFFTINVTIFGKDCSNPASAIYKLGPKTSCGPIEMMEVQA